MTNRISMIAITALLCLPIGVLFGVLIHANQSYKFQTLDSHVGSGRGFGELTGFFRKDSKWLGGYSKTDGRNTPEWFAFYNRDGERDGPIIRYWPKGNISEVMHYQNGKRHGQYVAFSRNGNLNAMAYYNDDELVEDSNFRNLNPRDAINDFFANIGKANLQLEKEFQDEWFRDLPHDSILKKNE